MRRLMSFHKLKSKGIKSGEYRGQETVFMPKLCFAAMAFLLLYPVGSFSSAIKYEVLLPRCLF